MTYDIFPSRVIRRLRGGVFLASGEAYDNTTDDKYFVKILYNFIMPETVELLSVTITDETNGELDIKQCRYDPADFITLTTEFSNSRSKQEVNWARKIAGV